MRSCVMAAVVAASMAGAGSARATDWPDWRGPMQDRHYAGPPLVTSFDPEKGTNVLWKNDEAGGISTPVIIGGRIFTLVRHKPGTKQEAEKVLCLDAKTGEKLWENVFNVYLSDAPAERVGWSAIVADPASNTVFATASAECSRRSTRPPARRSGSDRSMRSLAFSPPTAAGPTSRSCSKTW